MKLFFSNVARARIISHIPVSGQLPVGRRSTQSYLDFPESLFWSARKP